MIEMTGTATLQYIGATAVLRAYGDIDIATIDALRTPMEKALLHEGPGVVVDLTDVTYLDSAGVRLLFDLRRRLSPAITLVMVLPGNSLIRKVIELVCLPAVVPVYPTLASALDACTQADGSADPRS